MPYEFTCPECAHRVITTLPPGRTARCQNCKSDATVPEGAKRTSDVPEFVRTEPRAGVEGARASIARSKMIVTSTSSIEGMRITDYLGMVSGQAVMGVNAFKDLAASIRDVVGGRSRAYEGELAHAKEHALADAQDEASRLGADAIVGVKLDFETVGGTMLMVAASGTAVNTEPVPEVEMNQPRRDSGDAP